MSEKQKLQLTPHPDSGTINYGSNEEDHYINSYIRDPNVPETPIVEDHVYNTKEPVDKYNLVYWAMFLQGTGCLFPWNAFISAPDYFVRVYNNNQILSYFSLAHSYPNLGGLLLMIFFGSRIPIKIRVLFSYAVCILLVLIIPIMGFLKIENYPQIGLPVTLVGLFFIALATACLQGSIFGLAGSLPPSYMVIAMTGNGMAGVLVSVIRVISKMIIERGGTQPSLPTLTISTSIYFFMCSFILFTCFVTFIFLSRTEFVLYYMKKAEQSTKESLLSKKESFGVISNEDIDTPNKGLLQTLIGNIKFFFGMLRKIWPFALYIFFVFVITIGVFPAFLGFIKSSYKIDNWLPVILICAFNIFDLIGRYLPGTFALPKGSIGISVLLRVVFVPLFILCVRPRLFRNDFIPVAIMSTMSLTNGYFSSLCMMYAPGECEPNERVAAGTFMTFMLVFGILMGANLGTVLTSFF